MRYGIHCCLLDRDCRVVGAPARLHLRGPRRNIGIALSRNGKFSGTRLLHGQLVPGRDSWVHVVHHPTQDTGH